VGFGEATAVGDEGGGRFAGEIRPGWDIGGNANGGYLLAIAARAMSAACGRPDPVTVTAHYLAPAKAGAVTVDTEVVKSGKRFSTVRATMQDAERPLLTVLGAFSELPEAGAEPPLRVDAEPPDLPPPDDCLPHRPGERGMPPPFASKVDIRLHPDDAGFARGRPSGQLLVRGWFRHGAGEAVDTIGLLQATDAYPPTIFNADLPVAWTPTVELTAHVRARPAPGWLRCAFTTRFVTGGFLEEDGVVWDDTGTLVAQSRQLALVPRPA
jgi:acyl-CoA thioesterase